MQELAPLEEAPIQEPSHDLEYVEGKIELLEDPGEYWNCYAASNRRT